MNSTEKKEFINSLTSRIAADLCKHVDAGRIPETWDGHELRVLLATCFNNEVSSLMRKTRSKRMKDCRNEILVNNLDRLPR